MNSSPSGSSGTGTGSTANVYTPQAQPTADYNWQQQIQPLLNAAANGGAGTPAGQNYPAAENLVQQYLTGGANGALTPFNNFSQGALQGAQTSAAYGNDLFNQGTANSSALSGAASGGLPYGQSILNNAFNPLYGGVLQNVLNNSFTGQAMAGAQQGAQLGGAGANQLQGMADNLQGVSQQIGQSIPQLQGAASSILNTGFDPQSALFNRTQQQTLDQSNVVNAMSGLGGTPYGASVSANAMGNMDINWQNQQLARQTQAGSSAQGLDTAAASIGGMQGQLAGEAGNLYQAAPGLAASSAALPSGVNNAQNANILSALNAQNTAGTQGAAGYNNLLSASGQGLSSAQNLGTNAATTLNSLSAGPYNTGANIANNAVSGLTSATNLGNTQYALPEQMLNSLQSYMQLGQSASGMSGTLGQTGINQLGQTVGGGLAGLGAINSLTGGGLTSAGSSMLGLGSGAGAAASGLIPAAGSIVDAGSAGAGLGMDIMSAAPAAAMSSDRRLKTDIKRVGTLDNGLSVYLYRLRGDPVARIGLMADEVEKVHPGAVVTGLTGFKAVFYDQAVV